jgi:aspartate-semialdehyde dehydrogenase
MRCHSQALTIKLRRDVPLAEIESMLASAHEWVRVIPNEKDASLRELTPAAVTERCSPRGPSAKACDGRRVPRRFTVGDQLLWGAAEPLRRMLRILQTARVSDCRTRGRARLVRGAIASNALPSALRSRPGPKA